LASQQQLVDNSNNLNVRLQAYESAMNLMKSPDIAVVQMPGSTVPTSPDPNSLAIVYWNTRTKEVYLMFNNMPRPEADKQYQLWAIVDGKPVDAGLIAGNGENVLIKMKNISGANAFAVTLESKGGNPSPQGQMYVLGNVKA
jgi:anti-sigma-K factor RskA